MWYEGWIQNLDCFMRKISRENNPPNDVDRERLAMARAACSSQDYQFIILHQIYCVWSGDPPRAHQLFPKSPHVVDIERAFGAMREIFWGNENLSSSAYSFLTTFPIPLESGHWAPPWQLECAFQLLKWLGTNWPPSQPCHYMVVKSIQESGCESALMEMKIFAAWARPVGISEASPQGLRMEEAFRDAQKAFPNQQTVGPVSSDLCSPRPGFVLQPPGQPTNTEWPNWREHQQAHQVIFPPVQGVSLPLIARPTQELLHAPSKQSDGHVGYPSPLLLSRQAPLRQALPDVPQTAGMLPMQPTGMPVTSLAQPDHRRSTHLQPLLPQSFPPAQPAEPVQRLPQQALVSSQVNLWASPYPAQLAVPAHLAQLSPNTITQATTQARDIAVQSN